jgi:large subunit ribosomal protein L25
MEQVTLSATQRTESGTRPAKRLRREGLVPAVVYGRGIDPVSVTVASRELYSVLHTDAGLNAIINVEVEDGDTILTVAREIQRHPVRGEITHLDFIKVSLDVAIQAEVALEFVGVPIVVRDEGAIVETIAGTVLVEALPTAVPSHITYDISELEIGDTVKIEDLPVLDGVTYVEDGDRPLVTVLHARVEEPDPVAAEVEGEEGAEAAAEADAGTDEDDES